ncbi:hypothetical protein Tco_1057859 [Tanacetum coccineum]|uniref:Uncharacterized protein n=1 Tax=Tanacetum coccineum TaxID=301880 RepID=A0ABQ5H8E1_9ASTR
MPRLSPAVSQPKLTHPLAVLTAKRTLWYYDDDEDGGGGSGVVEVARGASGVVDRVDRSDGESFGLRRKNPPEKFSCGGGMVAGGGWPVAGYLREREEGDEL